MSAFGAGDTIAAVATAPGEAGIGIVRVSGPGAFPCARALFRRERGGQLTPFTAPPPSHRVTYGVVVHPDDGRRLDSCLLTCFHAPRSYTGEDVAEFACHGSNLVLALVLRGALASGARPAEPGEFTQRAFLNGRLDLAAAESVMDIISARTTAALRVAAGQHGGHLSRAIRRLRAALIELLAEIEAAIDFPDDVEPPTDEAVAARAGGVRTECRELLRTADAGRLYREGAALVIAGRPNVGKSSLLNALLGENRAIVTDVAGTTRDVIEEGLNLGGIPVRAADTAGLRETTDSVEMLGVARTRARLAEADLVVWVLDASEGYTVDDEALLPDLAGRPLVVVANKTDRGDRLSAADERRLRDRAPELRGPIARISCNTGAGLDELPSALAAALPGGSLPPESILVSNARHGARLAAADESLTRAVEAAATGFDQAAIALDLKLAAEALGEITGETVVEETITRIFARFCVGK